MNSDLEQLKAQVAELLEWKRQREQQQLVHPVDDVSKAAIGALIGNGAGSKPLTQTITIGATGGSATVPAAFSGTRLVLIEGSYYAIPYL